MVWWFDSPRISFGEDALDDLERIPGEHVVVVTDPVVRRLGLADRARAVLERGERQTMVWDGAEPDPRVSVVRQASEALREASADLIVAVGGGSVIDTAKAAWVLYESPGTDLVALSPFDELGLRQKARLACVPTTAGTGSEATRDIVIREDETGRKFGTMNSELVPDYAILDPEMVRGLPRDLTAYTGMDALTHAVEGYFSIWKNDFSDACSLQAVKMIFEWLPQSVDNLSDTTAREKMLAAACLGGLSFSNSQVTLAHTLGHSLGSVLRVHHGLAVGMALPYVLEYVLRDSPETTEHIAQLGRLIGVTEVDAATAAQKFVERLRDLQARVGFPQTLSEAGVTKSDFENGLERLVEFAMMDTSLTMTPRDIDANGIRRIYKCMFKGRHVDF